MSAHPTSTRGVLTAAVRGAGRFDRSAVSWPGGLIASIPVVAVLGIPIAAGDPVAGVTMAAGAMLVGIAWRVQGGRPPLGIMAIDTLMMGFATFVGCVSGSVLWVHLVVLAALALLGGLLVGVGNRGAAIGNQMVIAAIVFGRFSEPLGGAAGLAALVMSGGVAQVLFQMIVRWPSPLRAQRLATAAGYRSLSALASGGLDATSLPAGSRLDAARDGLSAPALFGDPAITTLRTLVDEGYRMRVSLTAIRTLERRCAEDSPPAIVASEMLSRATDSLKLCADVLEGDLAREDELTAAIVALTDRLDEARGDRTFAGDPSAAVLGRQLAALAGQLRAAGALVPSAARGGGLRSRRPRRPSGRPLRRLRLNLWRLRGDLRWESPVARHALRLAVIVPAAELIARQLPLARGYWMVVAAAMVLRPEFGATFTRGAERALGTSVGVGIAGLLAAWLHPAGAATVALVAIFAWLAYATFPASFAVGFSFITALVVFLLNVIYPDTLATASARLLDTLVGGAFGLIVFALWPTWSEAPARQSLSELIEAERAYLSAVLGWYAAGTDPQGQELRDLTRRLRLARVNADATVARSLSEPSGRQIDRTRAERALAAQLRLARATHVLGFDARDRPERDPVPEVAPLARALDLLLARVRTAVASGGRLRADALPDVRGGYDELSGADPDPDLLAELDEVVDAANSLAAAVTDET
ncbi:MAG TPA: FUSC family protein [Solirubrobacteraceae bacterium]|nr:FUSC family protein [Solirubrobacteraceae bacterium]